MLSGFSEWFLGFHECTIICKDFLFISSGFPAAVAREEQGDGRGDSLQGHLPRLQQGRGRYAMENKNGTLRKIFVHY